MLFGLIATGFMTLSSFTTVPNIATKAEKEVSVSCHIIVYSHIGSTSYVDHYYLTTDSSATCNAIAQAMLE